MTNEVHLASSDNAHIDRRFDEIMDELKNISSAFAKNSDGTVDFEGHRRYHEAMIKAASAQEQFWNDLKLEIAKKGVWGLLTIIVGLVLVGISAKFGIGAK